MLRSIAIEIEPGINPEAEAKYRRAHTLIVEAFRERYDFNAVTQAPCFYAANQLKRAAYFPPFRFDTAVALFEDFDRPIFNIHGNIETGVDLVTAQHPQYPETKLAVDPAGYLFGFLTIDSMPSVIGSRTFMEDAFARIYAQTQRIHEASMIIPVRNPLPFLTRR